MFEVCLHAYDKVFQLLEIVIGRVKLQIQMYSAIDTSSSMCLHLVAFRVDAISLRLVIMQGSIPMNPTPDSHSLRRIGAKLTEEKPCREEIRAAQGS